ncbi:Tetratricopeptide repeat-containing protein [Duganella sp. CF458]|uniref:tetratricopeptide repeat protein n=1 Tax=Duganella sp. CF458 TaxID=1884368 RepID=UPI0008E5BAEA|nr:tetratricopeptide repeat protein [Duganella sp. CF458]SFG58962.1 Tetratricopeptide repeat-containing protein [Duganella sp. CF458]
MIKFRLAHFGLVMAAIGFNAAVPMMGVSSIAYAENVRAEVGKPLQEAQKLASSGRYKEALAKLKEADAVGGKSELEKFQIEYTRGSAATAAGENETAARAFEQVLASPKLSSAQAPKITEALASIYLRARDYPKAITYIQKVLKDNPNNSQMREQLIQTYYQSGKLNEAAKELQGAKSEGSLQMLANIQLKQNDKAGYVQTLEKLAASYPKASYWADLLNRVVGKPGFSSSLNLDVMRLKLALKQIAKPAEFMEMGQLSLQAGNAAEALKIVDEGYKKGALGTGADAGRHQRLKDLAAKTLADQQKNAATQEANFRKEKDADGLANLGYAMVSDGKADGLKLMEEAIKLGTGRKPEEMKLHYGVAQYIAGKKAAAVSTLKSVKGSAGEPELARYWTMYINNPV